MSAPPPDGLLPLGRLDSEFQIGGRTTLAWDALRIFGSVFNAWLDSDGEIYLEVEILRRESPGRWSNMGGGGNTRGGWDVPFPPESGWPFEGLAVFGTSGLDVETEEGIEVGLDATFGFIAPPARTAEVRRGEDQRLLRPAPRTLAFAALSLGVEPGSLTALDDHNRRVGEVEVIGHRPYRAP